MVGPCINTVNATNRATNNTNGCPSMNTTAITTGNALAIAPGLLICRARILGSRIAKNTAAGDIKVVNNNGTKRRLRIFRTQGHPN